MNALINQLERMQCMEVWGGNRATSQSFETAGLKIWAYSQPYEDSLAGGDVYYLSSCASGRITRMLLADVSGHGEQVAGVAKELRDLMRRNVNVIKQTRFVSAMNQQFGELNDGQNFATALVSTFYAPSRTLTLCNAGHPPPAVYRQHSRQWSELSSDIATSREIADTPLGAVDEAVYYQRDFKLEPGDMVLSFSDAVTESEDAQGEPLGCKGILKMIAELNCHDPGQIIPDLVERITALNDANLRSDDATILLIEATGEGARLKDTLLAPFRLMRG
jgi:serine phosphatase RsbU (regulator of sigma subunit)